MLMSFIEKFEIKLEPRDYFYKPNDIINGELLIKVNKNLSLRKIRLFLVGIEQIFYNGYVNNGYTKNVVKDEQKILFHSFNLVELYGVEFIGCGEHHLQFAYKLPNGILSTFSGVYGHVQYYIEAEIERGVLSNALSSRVYFDVMSPSNFSVDQMRLAVGEKVEKTLRFLIFKTGSVRVSAHLDRMGYFVGDTVLVKYSIANRSSVRVIPRATLYRSEKYVTYDKNLFRKDRVIVSSSVANCIEPKSVSSGVIALKIPFNLKVYSFESSLIKAYFKIHVTLHIPNSFDLHINLPLLISNYVF